MNNEVFKLLPHLPPEMYGVWRGKKLRSNKALAEYASFYKRSQWMRPSLAFCILGAISAVIISNTANQLFVALMLLIAVAIVGAIYEMHRLDAVSALILLESDLTDSSLDLISYLKLGYDLKRINEHTYACLVQAARDVLSAEKRFSSVRQDMRMSEAYVVAAGEKLSQYRIYFDQMLIRTAEFGLSDGNPRPYFKEAQEKTP